MWQYLCFLKKKHTKTVHFEDITNPLMENDNLSRSTTIDNSYPNQTNRN
tara:strand:- start:1288 stop:1434 length:147 start_codon:yes stop_codon:yes gene_type:complete